LSPREASSPTRPLRRSTPGPGWLAFALVGRTAHPGQGGEPRGRQDVLWPGSADAVRSELERLSSDWAALLDAATAANLDRPFAFPWPEPRPFVFAAAWATSELTKSAAEIGEPAPKRAAGAAVAYRDGGLSTRRCGGFP